MNCKICKKESKYLEAHHIIPKSRGGLDISSNLIKLCSSCHGLAHDVSFSNERGGLIKEGVNRSKNKYAIDYIWYSENTNLVEDKMNELYDKDEDKYTLMILLFESGRFTVSHIRDWITNGSVKLKTSITF